MVEFKDSDPHKQMDICPTTEENSQVLNYAGRHDGTPQDDKDHVLLSLVVYPSKSHHHHLLCMPLGLLACLE